MKSTERFTKRVGDYVRARPSYPAGLIDLLRTECRLPNGGSIADLGSGTGILTAQLLEAGYEVFAVEPNPAMAEAATTALGHLLGFHRVDRPAESTELPDAAVDLVVAAQAFHWFDVDRARVEVRRILRPEGAVALIWNSRRTTGTALAEAYEAMLARWADGYERISRRWGDAQAIGRFFGHDDWVQHKLPNHQTLDRELLRSRLLSSSYAPSEGDARHEPMVTELDRIFDAHAVDGFVRLEYDTDVYCGAL